MFLWANPQNVPAAHESVAAYDSAALPRAAALQSVQGRSVVAVAHAAFVHIAHQHSSVSADAVRRWIYAAAHHAIDATRSSGTPSIIGSLLI